MRWNVSLRVNLNSEGDINIALTIYSIQREVKDEQNKKFNRAYFRKS